MQIFSNQILSNVSRNVQRFGLGVAILASALVGQSEAQVNFILSDIAPTASSSRMSDSKANAIERIHRYSLDEAGNLHGQITVTGDKPNGLGVYAMQGKQVVHQATTNALGEFSLAQIAPGQYSIVIAGRNQLAAQGIMIDRDRSQNANDFFELSTIRTGYQGVQDLVTTALPQQISKSLAAAESDFRQVSATFSDIPIAKQVQIINGNIRGQVVSLINENNIAGTTIHMLQADSGMAAMRIEAIANKTPMKMVSFTQPIPTTLSIPLAEDCPCNQVQGDQTIQHDNQQAAMEVSSLSPVEYANESIGCGGCCGGCGGAAGNFSNVGGAGFSAGGGSLSRLLTLASLAGAVTALADDDPEPASNESN